VVQIANSDIERQPWLHNVEKCQLRHKHGSVQTNERRCQVEILSICYDECNVFCLMLSLCLVTVGTSVLKCNYELILTGRTSDDELILITSPHHGIECWS